MKFHRAATLAAAAGLGAAFAGSIAAGCATSTGSSSEAESVTSTDAGDGSTEGPADAGCPLELPADCPSPAPSWTGEVQAVVDRVCNGCHGDGGIEQSVLDYSTYQGVFKNRGDMLDQLYACLMPPPDAAAPTPDELQALLAWLVCGAPDN